MSNIPHFLEPFIMCLFIGKEYTNRYLELRKIRTAVLLQTPGKRTVIFWRRERDAGHHHLACEHVGLTIDNDVENVIHPLNYTLNLSRIHLLPANVDQIAIASEDPHPFTVHLNHIASLEPAVIGERTRRIEIAEHGGFGLDL